LHFFSSSSFPSFLIFFLDYFIFYDAPHAAQKQMALGRRRKKQTNRGTQQKIKI
jgi:hypothetical protein